MDLLTNQRAKVAEANVVLYDALANEELLSLLLKALKIFVGKKKRGMQDEINQLIVDNALTTVTWCD
jgi:uroporphyrin-III C-methyltransferase